MCVFVVIINRKCNFKCQYLKLRLEFQLNFNRVALIQIHDIKEEPDVLNGSCTEIEELSK